MSKHVQATYAVPVTAQLGMMSDGSEAAIAAATNAAKRNIFGWPRLSSKATYGALQAWAKQGFEDVTPSGLWKSHFLHHQVESNWCNFNHFKNQKTPCKTTLLWKDPVDPLLWKETMGFSAGAQERAIVTAHRYEAGRQRCRKGRRHCDHARNEAAVAVVAVKAWVSHVVKNTYGAVM